MVKKLPERDSREMDSESTKATEMKELRAECEATKATEMKELCAEDSGVGTQQDLEDDEETKDNEECRALNEKNVEKQETSDKTEKTLAPPP